MSSSYQLEEGMMQEFFVAIIHLSQKPSKIFKGLVSILSFLFFMMDYNTANYLSVQVLVGESIVKQDDPRSGITGLFGKDISV